MKLIRICRKFISLQAIFFIACGLVFQSCNWFEKEPNAFKIPTAKRFTFYPIQYGDNLVVPTAGDDSDKICSINGRTGKINWFFEDALLSKIYYNFTPVVKDSFLILPIQHALLCLNANNGKVIWRKNEYFGGESHIYEADGLVYRSYKNSEPRQFEIVGYNIFDGEKKYSKIVTSAKTNESIFRSPIPIQVENKSKLVSLFIEYEPNISTSCQLVEYDFSADTERFHELYPKNSKGEGASLSPIVDHSFSYWVSENIIIAFSHVEFSEKWRIVLPKGLLTSRLNQNENSIFVPCEDEYLYCLNKSDGRIRWKTEIGGTPSKIFVSKNDIYVIGGSNQILFKVDMHAGQILAKYRFRNNAQPLSRVAFIDERVNIVSDGKHWVFNSLEDSTIFEKITLVE